ncbi:uncharacterized protein LOC111623356 [Centruroides sculpturatus]|uniref:uncharacterized protein LOC111623356 n=1 Tax=Centruroides sculpturatus TaxID=218467 RepID=UPI000C6E8B40|nr:uncharacterized protein LOC111623356 [Centruroides sculpturatus]XP_023221673.1 uncharacterized protein LOC111623356 [Centruroides sculpturatus]
METSGVWLSKAENKTKEQMIFKKYKRKQRFVDKINQKKITEFLSVKTDEETKETENRRSDRSVRCCLPKSPFPFKKDGLKEEERSAEGEEIFSGRDECRERLTELSSAYDDRRREDERFSESLDLHSSLELRPFIPVDGSFSGCDLWTSSIPEATIYSFPNNRM